ncbi:hypothetical protein BCL69_104915 [Nitrosomonas communis]|uniref:Uncharacterized protein n=1 Tax=Nitrosomonas communis TaxID=44574 RepID=A0A5D3Y948_9PROT|nr:hypothetical protein BCL69_104915 [Nitrosomonas communis]
MSAENVKFKQFCYYDAAFTTSTDEFIAARITTLIPCSILYCLCRVRCLL